MNKQTESPFAGLYAPIDDVAAYLERIGFSGKAEPTVDCLKRLVHCHLTSVPFENLDIFYGGEEPSLETEKMFDKIVKNRRGGYCFELNGSFAKLLEAIGFSVFGAMARIVLERDFSVPFSHRVNFADIDGERYFCDVGYGGPGPKEPIRMVYNTAIKTQDGKHFCFVKDGDETLLQAELDGEMRGVLRFSQTPCDPCEFLPLNTFCSKSEYEPFVHRLILSRMTEHGKCTVNGNVLRVKESDVISERELRSREDIKNALKQWFGIDYSGLE